MLFCVRRFSHLGSSLARKCHQRRKKLKTAISQQKILKNAKNGQWPRARTRKMLAKKNFTVDGVHRTRKWPYLRNFFVLPPIG